jgi:hypothetical protein
VASGEWSLLAAATVVEPPYGLVHATHSDFDRVPYEGPTRAGEEGWGCHANAGAAVPFNARTTAVIPADHITIDGDTDPWESDVTCDLCGSYQRSDAGS